MKQAQATLQYERAEHEQNMARVRQEMRDERKKHNRQLAELRTKLKLAEAINAEASKLGPLAGRKISMCENGALTSTFRDMVVKLLVIHEFPAHRIFAAIADVFESTGVAVTGKMMDSKRHEDTVYRCLVETATMLFDDQVRRMAEAGRPTGEPARTIRTADTRATSPWAEGPRQQKRRRKGGEEQWINPGSLGGQEFHREQPPAAEGAIAVPDLPPSTAQLYEIGDQLELELYEENVMKHIGEQWLDCVDYNPKHLPDPRDIDLSVSVEGEEEGERDFQHVYATDQEESTGCALLYAGVDGTTHGRNDREVLGCNVGGYDGAPARGEFGFLRENHTGISGPRHELSTILAWLVDVRRRQSLLGYGPGERTYLYDIPVWVVVSTIYTFHCLRLAS